MQTVNLTNEEYELSISDKLVSLFTEPSKLFADLSHQKPKTTDWLIPLFVLMAAVLQRSGVAADLYATIKILFGRVRGGLAIGTIVICTLFAAMAGISGAAILAAVVILLVLHGAS